MTKKLTIRSLQVRLPLLAVSLLVVSLAVAAFIVFEALLLTGEDRLDAGVERESLQLREHLARVAPGALVDATEPPPSREQLATVIERYLEQETRDTEQMTVVRIGDTVLTNPTAPTSLELLRSRDELPTASEAGTESLVTLGTSEGDVRVRAVSLRAVEGEQVSAVVVGSLADIRDRAFLALSRMGTAAAIGLVLAGISLAVMIRRVLRPLRQLADAAQNAELEHLSERVDPHGRSDEVSRLAEEFNRMLDRLEFAVADQRRFMAAVSHELRTPITIARGHLELLDDGSALPPERVIKTVRLVRDELLQMQRLVADLLALGRADDADFVVRQPVHLRDFFDDLHLRVVGLGTTGVEFESVSDEMIAIDTDRLAQAMLNLIANADLHASGRSRVVVGAAAADDSIDLFVSDDGAGVDETLRDSVFEPFVRSEDALGSTGLGLSVVLVIAEAHGGSVSLDTGSDGTKVTIRLPRQPVAHDHGGRNRVIREISGHPPQPERIS